MAYLVPPTPNAYEKVQEEMRAISEHRGEEESDSHAVRHDNQRQCDVNKLISAKIEKNNDLT
jgi:hypothetical protein